MNSWVKTCISEGSPGAKLGDGLRSPGPGMAGVNQWAVREHTGFYFYLFFLLNGASAWLQVPAWESSLVLSLRVVQSRQGPAVTAVLCQAGILGNGHRTGQGVSALPGVLGTAGTCMAGDHRAWLCLSLAHPPPGILFLPL